MGMDRRWSSTIVSFVTRTKCTPETDIYFDGPGWTNAGEGFVTGSQGFSALLSDPWMNYEQHRLSCHSPQKACCHTGTRMYRTKYGTRLYPRNTFVPKTWRRSSNCFLANHSLGLQPSWILTAFLTPTGTAWGCTFSGGSTKASKFGWHFRPCLTLYGVDPRRNQVRSYLMYYSYNRPKISAYL